MTLELNPNEQEVLAEALKSYLSDLRMEIADTENEEFRNRLKQKEGVLRKIEAALE